MRSFGNSSPSRPRWCISSRAPSRDPVAGALLLAAVPLFAAGVLAPALSVTSFAVFGATYSLLDGVLAFRSEGRHALFLLVLTVSLLLPVAKLTVGLWEWWRPAPADMLRGRALGWISSASRWSMLDVAIVAVLVLVLEGSLFSAADIHIGLVLFAASVLASSAALHRLGSRRAGPAAASNGEPAARVPDRSRRDGDRRSRP